MWPASLPLRPLLRVKISRSKEKVSASQTTLPPASTLMSWRRCGRKTKQISKVLSCPWSTWERRRTRLSWASMRKKRRKYTKQLPRHTLTDTFILLIRKQRSRKSWRRSTSCTRPTTESVCPTCSSADKWSESVHTLECSCLRPRKSWNSRSKPHWLRLPISLGTIVSINCKRSSSIIRWLIIDLLVPTSSTQKVQMLLLPRVKRLRLHWAQGWALIWKRAFQTSSMWCSWKWSEMTRLLEVSLEPWLSS